MADGNVIRIEIPRLKRRIPGLGEVVFRAPGAAAEASLAEFYASAEPDYRAFVNDAVAGAIETPVVDAARIEMLSERARASCRVAVAEVAGCAADYRRLAGKGLSGDERLLAAMRSKHERDLERLRLVTGAMVENVVRMAERTRKAFVDSGALDAVMRNQRQFEKLTKLYTPQLPDYFARVDRIKQQLNRVVMPPVIDQLTRQDSALSSFTRGYLKLSDNIARQLESVARPSYFGALAKLSEQINRSVRPAYLDQIAHIVEQTQRAVGSTQVGELARTFERLQRLARPRYVEQFNSFAERLVRAPAFERLREQLLGGVERYYAWLERNWAAVYGDERRHPILFLLAALPMAIGLPLLRALSARNDEPLLQALEDALKETTLVDALQQAVQASPELDGVGKRYLVAGLESVRDQRYIDAAPPLALGLERAFTQVALRRQILDAKGKFLVVPASKKRRRKKVEDLFEPLGLDAGFMRYLHAWVFGDYGNPARHGTLPEAEHRRWVLRAVVALVGWFEYCANDAQPMGALVKRLELAAGDAHEDEDEQTA